MIPGLPDADSAAVLALLKQQPGLEQVLLCDPQLSKGESAAVGCASGRLIRGIQQPAVPFEGFAQVLAAAHRLSWVTLVPYWLKL